jgi:hypothetical protein
MVATVVHLDLVTAPELMLTHQCWWHERIGGIWQVAVHRLAKEPAVAGRIEPARYLAFDWREVGRRAIERNLRSCAAAASSNRTATTTSTTTEPVASATSVATKATTILVRSSTSPFRSLTAIRPLSAWPAITTATGAAIGTGWAIMTRRTIDSLSASGSLGGIRASGAFHPIHLLHALDSLELVGGTALNNDFGRRRRRRRSRSRRTCRLDRWCGGFDGWPAIGRVGIRIGVP